MKNNLFRPREKDENLLGPEVPYLSVIYVLMYLANCTAHILLFLSIYYPDIVLLKLKDIVMESKMCYIIFVELLIWVYFTQMSQSHNYSDMWMQAIFQIHIKPDHKPTNTLK